MKRLFVFVPAVLLVLFLLNSFVLKDKETAKKTSEIKLSNNALKFFDAARVANIVLRSTDGGQTWQDISKGLPERLQRESIWSHSLFTNDRGLYLLDVGAVYHSELNSKTSFWTKEIFPGNQREITPGNNGIYAYNFRGEVLKKINGTNKWSPMFTDFQEQATRIDKTTTDWMYKNYQEREVRAIFETTGGTVFISSNNMLFKSTDNGKTWKQVHAGDGRMKLIESNGVLLSTSNEGILRSTDNGENWQQVINEGGAGIAVEPINGGFAAIVNNEITKTNTVHISQDNGQTWNTIAEKLQPSLLMLLISKATKSETSLNIMSIKQVGKYLICGRPDGLFRSSDMGKTWEKLSVLPEKNSGFNLSVSGDVIYALPNKGC